MKLNINNCYLNNLLPAQSYSNTGHRRIRNIMTSNIRKASYKYFIEKRNRPCFISSTSIDIISPTERYFITSTPCRKPCKLFSSSLNVIFGNAVRKVFLRNGMTEPGSWRYCCRRGKWVRQIIPQPSVQVRLVETTRT